MPMLTTWYFILPGALSVLYCFTQYRSFSALGFSSRTAKIICLTPTVAECVLVMLWAALGYPLPVAYLLAYLCRAVRLLGMGHIQMKNWFVLNLSYVNTIALHLSFIGGLALFQNVTMHTLLQSPFWRAASLSVVLASSVIEDTLFLRWPNFSTLLSAEAESAEARPFMAFLWFCTGYLLVDSLLCMVELEPLYPPLFLIGSSAVLMFILIRFLLHINAIIRNEHYKDEHDRLEARLEAAQEDAGALKRVVDKDTLTGAFSRRYIIERISAMIESRSAFSLAFVDLDGLKQINDQEGHDAGDRYLMGFVRALEDHLREGDQLARVGGDEFVVLMPGCDVESARRRIHEIRTAFEKKDGVDRKFLFSFGATSLHPGEERNAEVLLQDADRAMYQDKRQRRQERGCPQ